MKYKKLKKLLKQKEFEADELSRMLGIANANISDQIDHINSLNSIIEMNERHMRIAESAINRKDIIIGYLETKDLK